MTAEIALLNQHGLVLAADSAVTIGGGKVYNSARKLFTLSSNHSVGIMVYGNASLMQVPWEIIIKKFSKNLGNTQLAKTENYVQEFFLYLSKEELLNDADAQMQYVYNFSLSLTQILVDLIGDKINLLLESHNIVTDEFLASELNQQIDRINTVAEESEPLVSVEKKVFLSKYSDFVHSALKNVIISEKVVNEISNNFEKLVYNLIFRSNNVISPSGLVIAGFGSEDSFPSLYSFEFQAKILDKLIYSKDITQEVGVTNSRGKVTSSIVPFAQQDVVDTVIRGLAPEISNEIFRILQKEIGLDESNIENVLKKIQQFQDKNFSSKMVNTVQILQIDELAEVAETLINLTGFKRKYTSDLATVGGPIDVLAISLGEGPIWIKRKHYFDICNNVDFKIRKERQLNGE